MKGWNLKNKNSFGMISCYYFLIIYFLFIPSAKAYAGPGIAIAGLIVLLTVILTTSASVLIFAFNLIKNIFLYIKKITKRLISKRKNKKKESN